MIPRINIFKLSKILFRLPKINSSVVSYSIFSEPLESNIKENWSEIYRLPLIRVASAFNKLKIYQTFVTAAGTPAILALEQAGQLDPNFGFVFATVGITGILTLSICSWPIHKLIGFIYINDRNDKIKIDYVDFWGRRQYQVLNVADILCPWEIPERKINLKILDDINLYQRITHRDDESKSYKLLNRFGVISNPERYVKVFGE